MLNKNKISNWKPLLAWYMILALAVLFFFAILTHEASAKIYINGSNSGDSFNMEIPDVEAIPSYLIYHPWYLPGFTFAKNQTTGKIEYYGTDDATVLQSVLDAGSYRIFLKNHLQLSNNITIKKPTYIESYIPLGIGVAGTFTGYLNYTGPSAVTSLINVYPEADGTSFKNLVIDGNNKVGTDIFLNVTTGNSLHEPSLENIVLQGYTYAGLVTGINSTSATGAGQISDLRLDRIWFNGGTAGAIGWLVNAQNLEWAVANNIRFDPPNGKEHTYHVYDKYGAIVFTGLLTTRSTTYAIFSNDQLIVNGWRAEDQYLLSGDSVSHNAPTNINGLQHRWAGALTDAIYYKAIGKNSPLVINGAIMGGNIVFAPTDARYFSLNEVYFNQGNVNLQGTKNQYGRYSHNGTVTSYVKGNATTNYGSQYITPSSDADIIAGFQKGDMYFNNTRAKWCYFNGTGWNSTSDLIANC